MGAIIWEPSGQPTYGTHVEPGCTPHIGPIRVTHMGPIYACLLDNDIVRKTPAIRFTKIRIGLLLLLLTRRTKGPRTVLMKDCP